MQLSGRDWMYALVNMKVTPFAFGENPRVKSIAIMEIPPILLEAINVDCRYLALYYVWMSNIEHARVIAADAGLYADFVALHADEIDIILKNNHRVTRPDELSLVIKGLDESAKLEWHRLLSIDVSAEGETLRMSFSLEWLGMSHQDRVMTAKTRHVWVLEKNNAALVDKVKSIRMTLLEPFAYLDGGGDLSF